MKKKFRTTSFWLGLSGAVVIVLETLSNIIGHSFDLFGSCYVGHSH